MKYRHHVLLVPAAVLCMTLIGSPASANSYADNPESPTANGRLYRHGVVPSRERWSNMTGWLRAHPDAVTASGSPTLAYGGGLGGIGVTSGTPKVYLVVFGSQWGTQGVDANKNATFSGDPKGEVPRLQQLFKGLGTNNELWSGTMTQYCDGSKVTAGATSCPSGAAHVGYPTGGALAGVWYDNAAPSPASASGTQLAAEAIRAAAHFGNTTPASNRYAQYVILSPTGTTPDGFNTPSGGFCAWHDFSGDYALPGGAQGSNYGPIAFTNLGYIPDAGYSCGQNFVNSGSAGVLDGVTLVNGHEYAETLTDQIPGGGWINQSSSSYQGQEDGDECAWISSGTGASANVALSTGTFAMQSTWSNDTNSCAISHAIVGATTSGGGSSGGSSGGTPSANFSFVASALAVTFTDTSTDAGGTLSAHSWTFGDGATATTASPSHTYAKAGSYTVTETVTDSVNHKTSSKTNTVAVTTPPVGGTVLSNGVAVTGLSLKAGAWSSVYTFTIPSGVSSMIIQMTASTGTGTLYINYGAAPSTSTFLCRPPQAASNEGCQFIAPRSGTYYISVLGASAVTGMSLKASH